MLNPVGEGYFAGKVELATLSFLDRLMAQAVKSALGDFRDWDKIRAWSQMLLA
jgi:menaquinone-dependent protoporphyrinogen oxidase